MNFDRRVRQPIEIAGIQSGINQANQLGFNELQSFQAINQLNNKNMSDYVGLVDSLKEKGKEALKSKEMEALERVGEYGIAISQKYNEYKDFIKGGGKLEDLATVKLGRSVGGVLGKAGEGVHSSIKALDEAVQPTEIELQEIKNPANNPRQAFLQQATGEEGEVFQNENNRPNQNNRPKAEETDTEQPEMNRTGSDDARNVREESSNSGTDSENTLKAGEELEQAEEDASMVGKLSKGVAKAGGTLFSATMLSSDIYDQVKDKSFFYGENTGDKVGNFMNEIGSTADIVGVATGDPLLVMAGVGLGAVGGLVSDISELFGHHDQEKKPPPPPPPVEKEPTQVNLAGAGGIVQAQPSTLRSVEAGV